jgi:tetratricopeptide (TPR) repeat protein
LDSNDYDKAILYFQKTIGSSSGVLLFKDIDDFFGYLNIGLAYYMKENYDKSIEMLEKAVQLNTKYEKAYSLLGCAYAGNGNYDKAIEVFDKAIQISPEDANLNYNIGYAYRKTGYLVKATKYYKQAANLGQKDAQEYLKLHGVEWK